MTQDEKEGDIDTFAAQAGVTGLFEADTLKEQEAGVYEVGYHILPTLSDDEAAAAVKDLHAFLEKQGASFVGEKAPVKIDLAYTIEKRIGGRLTGFDNAYFGWMAFEIQPATLGQVKNFLDTNDSILRYLLITTSKEEVTAVMEGAVIMPTAPTPTGQIAAPKRVSEEGAAVSDEALSEALETMAKEDAAVKEA